MDLQVQDEEQRSNSAKISRHFDYLVERLQADKGYHAAHAAVPLQSGVSPKSMAPEEADHALSNLCNLSAVGQA